MALHGTIIPRPDLPSENLRALGAALDVWFRGYLADLARRDRDLDGWIDRDALRDLRAGELPQPVVLRVVSELPGVRAGELCDALELARAAYPMLHRVMAPPTARGVSFGFATAGQALNRDDLLNSLRTSIPFDWLAVTTTLCPLRTPSSFV